MTSPSTPNPFEGMSRKERNHLESRFDTVVEKVIANIIIRKSPKHLLREVYMAGLYHGTLAACNLSRPMLQAIDHLQRGEEERGRMSDLDKIIPYLRRIAKTQSLDEAQREARLALKLLGKEAGK